MRVFIITGIVFVLLNACFGGKNRSATSNEDTMVTDTTQILFEKDLHDFGKVKAGEEIACRFGFINIGQQPLVIQDIIAGCGCTNVTYPTKPVLPGYKDAVEVVFDTRGRKGHQRQVVRVISNGSRFPKELIIRAEVE